MTQRPLPRQATFQETPDRGGQFIPRQETLPEVEDISIERKNAVVRWTWVGYWTRRFVLYPLQIGRVQATLSSLGTHSFERLKLPIYIRSWS